MITPAQETVTMAMIVSLITCGVVSYALLRTTELAVNYDGIIVFVVASFLFSAYLIPRVTAWWLGRSLDDIMQ